MSFGTWLILALVGLVNLFANTLTWRSNLFTRNQKILQTALVWLIPAGGAMIVFAFFAKAPLKPAGQAPLSSSIGTMGGHGLSVAAQLDRETRERLS